MAGPGVSRDRVARCRVNHFQMLRYERGLTVQDVARRSGVSHMTIARLESGETAKPLAPVAAALAKVYGVTIAELLDLDPREAA